MDEEATTPRMRTHIAVALAYARDGNHGAPGHLDLLTIATLANAMDQRQVALMEAPRG